MNPIGFIAVTRVELVGGPAEQVVLAVRSIVLVRRAANTTHIVIAAPGPWESLLVAETVEEVLQKMRHASG